MKKTTLLSVLLLLTVLALTSVAANGLTFTTTMTGAAERPNPGDPDGTGTATIMLFPSTSIICWEIEVSGISLPATAAHIHKAPAGSPGPVIVPLSAPDESGTASGCRAVARDVIVGILQDPDEYYVNVHNADYPGGALRGQLSR